MVSSLELKAGTLQTIERAQQDTFQQILIFYHSSVEPESRTQYIIRDWFHYTTSAAKSYNETIFSRHK